MLENSSIRQNKIDDATRLSLQKNIENNEDGEVVDRMTIGADLGFIKRWNGKRSCVVFECNGELSGLTQLPRRDKKTTPYLARLFRDIRTRIYEPQIVSKINSLKMLWKVIGCQSKDSEEVDLHRRQFPGEYLRWKPFILLLENRHNQFVEIWSKFDDIMKTDSDFLTMKRKLKDLINEYLVSDLSEDIRSFFKILESIIYTRFSNLDPMMNNGYLNNFLIEMILWDKIWQQEFIPRENRIDTIQDIGNAPTYRWWVKKIARYSSQGKGVSFVHETDPSIVGASSDRDHLYQEMVRTIGADNASILDWKKHSAMRLLLDMSIRRKKLNGNWEYFVVIENECTTHNIYPVAKDTRSLKERFFKFKPRWARIEPASGANPIESSQREIAEGEEVVKKIALNLFKETRPDLFLER